MSFSFATCDRKCALEFIKKVYPSKDITDTPESAGKLLDFVEKDIVRIQDPMMHGMNIRVLPSNNWNGEESVKNAIVSACEIFHGKE